MNNTWNPQIFQSDISNLIVSFNNLLMDSFNVNPGSNFKSNLLAMSDLDPIEMKIQLDILIRRIEERLNFEVENIKKSNNLDYGEVKPKDYFNNLVFESFLPLRNELIEKMTNLSDLAAELYALIDNNSGVWGFIKLFNIFKSNPVDGAVNLVGKGNIQQEYKLKRRKFINLCNELAYLSENYSYKLKDITLTHWNQRIDQIINKTMNE